MIILSGSVYYSKHANLVCVTYPYTKSMFLRFIICTIIFNVLVKMVKKASEKLEFFTPTDFAIRCDPTANMNSKSIYF